MQASLARCLPLLMALSLSCYPQTERIVALESEVKVLKAQIQFQAEEKQDIKGELDQIRTNIEHEVRAIYARLNCTNSQVAEFLAECESDSEVCSPKGAENALQFMSSQPYVTLYLVPDQGIKSITLIRKGQLTLLAEPKNLHPSSRLLVLVQPREDTTQSETEAIEVGRGVSRYLRTEIKVSRGYRILGPKALPCKIKAEKLNRYLGRLDRVGPGEPPDASQRVRVWVFRTDC